MIRTAPASRTTVQAADWPPGFLTLYHDRYGHMVRLARLLTGRQDVAEELVQDAYVKVADRWAGVDNPSAYLRTAVVNACRSHQRRLGTEERYVAAQDVPVTAPPEVHGIWEELHRLTPRRRAAVVLRYWEDLDDTEIAEILRCRRSTVRSLIHRGLSQLEEVLR